MLIFNPLEQFELISLFTFSFFYFDLFFTNLSLFSFACILFFSFFCYAIFYKGSGQFYPTRWQILIEMFFVLVLDMVFNNIESIDSGLFPFVFSLFIFILQANLFGLVPYSFTVTSQLLITLVLAFSVWIGKLSYGYYFHGFKLFSFFLPKGAPFIMVPFLIFIELIGFFMVIISLSVRLFANMMAGHILLKVLAGFSWVMLTSSGFLFLLHFFPLVVLFLLLGLELGVAFIQAYVFTLLTTLYLSDMFSGGHLYITNKRYS
jgi:ATP synthase subunit 6